MDFTLSEEQAGAAAVAQSVFSGAAAFDGAAPRPIGAAWFDHKTWKRAADSGLVGLAVSADFGGSGLGVLETNAVLEQQGRYLARVPGVWSMGVGAPAIDLFGSAALRNSVLPGVVSGDATVSVAVVEGGSYCGERVGTTITSGSERIVLNGVKESVPLVGGPSRGAEWIITPTRTPDGTLRVVAVPAAGTGVNVHPEDTISGAPEARIEFDDAPVSPEWILRPKGADREIEDAASILDWLIERTCLAVCAVQCGIAAKVLEMTAAYTAERNVFGRPLATFQTVLARAADGHLALERMRWSMWLAAWLTAEGEDASAAVDVAKYWAAEGAETITLLSQQLHGGLGVDISYPLHEYTLWAKHYELTLGGAKAHLARIGAALADSPGLARGAGHRD